MIFPFCGYFRIFESERCGAEPLFTLCEVYLNEIDANTRGVAGFALPVEFPGSGSIGASHP